MSTAVIPDPVAQLLDIWTASLHTMTDDDFTREAERTEYLPKSPAAARMRADIDAERDARNGGDGRG